MGGPLDGPEVDGKKSSGTFKHHFSFDAATTEAVHRLEDDSLQKSDSAFKFTLEIKETADNLRA